MRHACEHVRVCDREDANSVSQTSQRRMRTAISAAPHDENELDVQDPHRRPRMVVVDQAGRAP
jgi:hypothetical protein